MSIAAVYGMRLLNEGANIDPWALNAIISDYPSHGFVIDRGEATMLFNNVREPSEIEVVLVEKLGIQARRPIDKQKTRFMFLSDELPIEDVNHINITEERRKYDTENRHAEWAEFGNDAEKTQ